MVDCYFWNDKFIEEKNAYETLTHHEAHNVIKAQNAYEILLDPAKKARYDNALRNAVLAQTYANSSWCRETQDSKHVTCDKGDISKKTKIFLCF